MLAPCLANSCPCSVAKSHLTLSNPQAIARKALLSSTISQSLLKLMSMESVTLSNYLILLLLPPSFPNTRVFSNESALHIRWPKYWSFSFSISLSNEYSGLIDLGLTGLISSLSKGLSSLLQHYNTNSSCSVRGFPGGISGKGSTSQCRRHKRRGFDSWVGKIPWEKGMATHPTILAWRIPWTEEPGEMPSTGSQRV